MGTIRQPWGKGAKSSDGEYSGGVYEINIDEANQVIELDLFKSTHFRIWVNGNYDFELPMPINGFDGQPFMVEIRGKKTESWDDDAIEAWVAFDWRWWGKGPRNMVSDRVGTPKEINYNLDEYFHKHDGSRFYLKAGNYAVNGIFWLLDSIVMNDFVLRDDDGLTYHQGVFIKEVMFQYPYVSFNEGELTSGGDW